MGTKISALTQSSLGTGDFAPIHRGSGNYRLNISGAVSSYIDSNSSYDGYGAGAAGKLVRYSSGGGLTGIYSLNSGAYVYNNGDLPITNAYNGKTIISNNSTGISYTVNSGLTDAFFCKVIRGNSGAVTFTGAGGVSVNSFGGSMAIAGRYGVANLHWESSNSYILEGNLTATATGNVSYTVNTGGYVEFTDGVTTVQVPTLE